MLLHKLFKHKGKRKKISVRLFKNFFDKLNLVESTSIKYDKYFSTIKLLALAVSTELYIVALDLAPLTSIFLFSI